MQTIDFKAQRSNRGPQLKEQFLCKMKHRKRFTHFVANETQRLPRDSHTHATKRRDEPIIKGRFSLCNINVFPIQHTEASVQLFET